MQRQTPSALFTGTGHAALEGTADPATGPHAHIDMIYLYELFRLSIRPLLRRDSLGYGRAVAVQGGP